MKIFAAILLFINLNTFAQVNGDWINSGLLKLRVNSDGQLATFNNAPASEIPAGSNNNIFKFVNLWISGYDSDNQLHISTTNGFGNKTDYSQGPIDSLTYAGADPSNWNYVWNVTSSQINTHRSSFKNKDYIAPDAIKNWPANGSGRFNKYLAPFIDYDQDGIYDATKGDYPSILGHQACFFILNDNYSEHKASGGQPLKVEVYGMLYSFNNLPAIIFGKYYFVNRTDRAYSNIKVSLHTAFELGNSQDNYCGTLFSKNMVFGYNGDDNDENHFGTAKPLAAAMILNHNLSSSLYISNDLNSETGMPTKPLEHRNFMEGNWKSSKPLSYGNDGQGNGVPAQFVYPGKSDPKFTSTNWVETQIPGERSILANLSYDSLRSKGFIEVDFALLGFASSQGDPYSFLETEADKVTYFWSNTVLGIKQPLVSNQLKIKNPITVGENIYCDWFQNFDQIELINQLGQQVNIINPKVEKELISLKSGIYFIRLTTNNQSITKKIIII